MLRLFSALRRGKISKISSLHLANAQRMKSGTAGCGNPRKDRCPKKFKDFPCGKPKSMMVKPTKKFKQPASIWLNPFCDEDQPYCPFNPRFDDIYYVESDKAKRKYWQTWVSCPPLQIKKKKICCFEKVKAAPLRRRKHKKPQTACPQKEICDTSPCPRLKRRCHRTGRIPPNCRKVKRPLFCTKPLTPYPSFSECSRMNSKSLPLSECICWQKPMLCEAWAEYRRRSMLKMR